MVVQLKLTSKGQITLKKEFLQHLGADAGTVLDVEKLADGTIKISAKRPKKNSSFAEFAGLFSNHSGKQFTIEELNDAIADAYAEAGVQGISNK